MAGDTRSKLHTMLTVEYSILLFVRIRLEASCVSEIERIIALDNVAGAVLRTLLEQGRRPRVSVIEVHILDLAERSASAIL